MEALEKELCHIVKTNNRIKIKNLIRAVLRMQYPKRKIAFWPNAMAIDALIVLNPDSKVIKKQINLWQKCKFRIDEYDDILMAYYLVTETNLLNKNQNQLLIDNIKTSLKKYRNEIIPYRKTNQNMAYIDLLGMVPQFLIHLGIKENNEELIDWGIKQFDGFIENAIDEKTGLLYHAYDIQTKDKKGIVGWGRALGWIMTGLADSINELGNSYPEKRIHLLDIYERIFSSIKKYQRKDGGLSWQLLDVDGALDTSATSMILKSMLELDEKTHIISRNSEFSKRMMQCLDLNYRNGKIINCSAECRGIGVYPQKYGSYAWSVAPYAICKNLSSNNPEMK